MTPHLDPQGYAERQSQIPRAVTVGVIIGLTIVGFEGLAVFALAKYQGKQVRRGWNLQEVLCATRDLKPGPVMATDAAPCNVPEQFVTETVLKPTDAAGLAKAPLIAELQKGSVLRWTDLATKAPAPMLFATRDLPVGAVIAEGDFAARPFNSDWVTPTWVRADDGAQLSGKKVTAAFAKGDPALWSHFAK
ncbi:MAG: SAF domain-containing protein [Archangium sp.]